MDNRYTRENISIYEKKRMQKIRQRRRLLRRRKKQFFCLLGIVFVVFLIVRCATNSSDSPTPTNVENANNTTVDTPNTEEPTPLDVLPSVSKSDWNLILLTEDTPLTSDVEFESRYLDNGMQVDARIYDELMQMLEDGTQTGLSFIVCSAYRTISYQEGLFNAQVEKLEAEGLTPEDAYLTAKTSIALPGTSEHHLGLAVDIAADAYRELDEHQATTPEYQWLRDNCHKYGFIVRYPEGRTDITGFIYEPWHFRYVGVEAATYIAKHDISLEEFLARL